MLASCICSDRTTIPLTFTLCKRNYVRKEAYGKTPVRISQYPIGASAQLYRTKPHFNHNLRKRRMRKSRNPRLSDVRSGFAETQPQTQTYPWTPLKMKKRIFSSEFSEKKGLTILIPIFLNSTKIKLSFEKQNKYLKWLHFFIHLCLRDVNDNYNFIRSLFIIENAINVEIIARFARA